jgi:putative cell wall-binding protein
VTRSFRRAAIALGATLLAASTTTVVAGLAGGSSAADQDTIAVAEFTGLSGQTRDRFTQRRAASAARAQAATAVAPEECLTETVGTPTGFRYAGATRYETSVCVSFWTWPDHDDPAAPVDARAQAVVLARGDKFPDALAGGPLAVHEEAPLLLTRPTQLLPEVRAEIERVLAPGGTVYILGSDSAISAGIQSELETIGFVTTRLAGSNRYETAIAIASALPTTSNFFFATGRNFPDALAAGTAAAAISLGAKLDGDPETRPFALLLTNGDRMPAVTADFVFDRGQFFGVWALVTAGSAGDSAAAEAFGDASLAARFVGSNRYETATEIAEFTFTDSAGSLFGPGVGLATGQNFPDALSATANLARFGEPLLLTQRSGLSGPTRTFLENHAGEADLVEVFGGANVVSDAILADALAAFAP